MAKEKSKLTTTESDRLRLLGFRMLMAMDNNFSDAVDRGIGSLENMRQVQGAIYHQPRFNFNLPHAWKTYKERVDSPYVSWFEENVIANPPAAG